MEQNMAQKFDPGLAGSRRYSAESAGMRLIDLARVAGADLPRLPLSLRILLENVARTLTGEEREDARHAITGWLAHGTSTAEIAFSPHRLLMHDTTCGPALVDIAAMRDVLAEAGRDPSALNPVLPVDVSVDHSIGVDLFASPDAVRGNMEREARRNAERFRLMKWAQGTLHGLRVHPPGTGILHTINLEQLATVVAAATIDGMPWLIPDTLIGTDSHTPMINGIGVLAWGVGGVEAEGVLFGLPVMMRVPDVIGVRLTGGLPEGTLATDLALVVTERLRRYGISGQFVEFFGPGVASLSAGDRSVVANMAPEYGATTAYFPIDRTTLDYLAATGRPPELVARVAQYARRNALWFDPQAEPRYTDVIDIDLSAVRISIAGPRRPQDRLAPGDARAALALKPSPGREPLWRTTSVLHGRGLEAPASEQASQATTVQSIPDGAVAIAAITSCTNTSDPRLTIAAGLLARKARAFGLRPPAYVKTSLSPGSPAAARYLQRAGLLADLEAIGFGIVGYGCMTCIGNSGPLTPAMNEAVERDARVPVAVLSGNRNFPGRVHPQIEAAFLASPPLVVAFALAGDVNRDILADPIGQTADGRPVTLAELWPTGAEIDTALAAAVAPADYPAAFDAAQGNAVWTSLDAPSTPRFPWDTASTYLRRPPFATATRASRLGRYTAHPLIVLGDDITTDQISPAAAIPLASEAGRYLVEHGDDPGDLNVYAARRGNWEIMLRGLFTNRTVRNLLGDAIPPGSTVHAPTGAVLPLWRAARLYEQAGESVVILAGERYGAGSSRDWAAKGPNLLGVRAVLAASFERIHRQNLIGMGVLPLRLPRAEQHPERLGLRPGDRIEIAAEPDALSPRIGIAVTLRRASGPAETLDTIAAVETRLEVELLRAGGVIPFILARALHTTDDGRSAGGGI
jgi:aconitate hydratase